MRALPKLQRLIVSGVKLPNQDTQFTSTFELTEIVVQSMSIYVVVYGINHTRKVDHNAFARPKIRLQKRKRNAPLPLRAVCRGKSPIGTENGQLVRPLFRAPETLAAPRAQCQLVREQWRVTRETSAAGEFGATLVRFGCLASCLAS